MLESVYKQFIMARVSTASGVNPKEHNDSSFLKHKIRDFEIKPMILSIESIVFSINHKQPDPPPPPPLQIQCDSDRL